MSKQIQDAYIVAATRTPIGRSHKGSFKHLRPDDLLAIALRSAMAQVPGLDPKAVEDVICGCAIPEAQQGLNVARIGAILAGLPNTVGGITVNRFCASGLSAVQMAADRIRVGEADVMIAAGTESMSMVPMMGNAPSLSPTIFTNTDDVDNYGIAYGMGLTAEKVAQQWKVSRDAQDAFAVRSHEKAIAAMKAGEFTAEITPVEVTDRQVNLETAEVSTSTRTVSLDEGARPDTTLEGLAKLRTVFAARGSVTAGNSSQTSDGAGALILASEAAVKRFGLKPLARFVSYASRGVPPHIMGIGPIEAIPAALRYAGLKQDDIESYGIAYGMGLTAEKVAQQWKVSRDAQDAFAVQSHQRAVIAMKNGEFSDEITPVTVQDRSVDLESADVSITDRTISLDEGARPDTTLEGLANLRTVFAARGSVTAGNSSQTSDGAGALILVSEAALKRYNLTPLARFVSYASRGVPPHIMGIGPVEAIPAALKNAGLTQDQIDWFELNEAFAAQSLAVMNTLGLDPAKVNPMGGAIALGHPLGATGAIRSATVVHALRRHNKQYGMVTMCVGMGQGAAGIFERV